MARHGTTSAKGDRKAKLPQMAKRNGNIAPRRGLPATYRKACELTRGGKYKEARAAYARLAWAAAKGNARLRVLIQNDVGVIRMEGNFDEACVALRAVLEVEGTCLPARLNLGLIEAEMTTAKEANSKSQARISNGDIVLPDSETRNPKLGADVPICLPPSVLRPPSCPRIAVLSFLFNWPFTGGGNMDTAGLVTRPHNELLRTIASRVSDSETSTAVS